MLRLVFAGLLAIVVSLLFSTKGGVHLSAVTPMGCGGAKGALEAGRWVRATAATHVDFRGSNQATATTWNQAVGVVTRLLKELLDRFFPKE